MKTTHLALNGTKLLQERENRLAESRLIYRLYRIQNEKGVGYGVSIARVDDERLYGEYAPLYLVSSNAESAASLLDLLYRHGVYPSSLGEVLEDRFGIFSNSPGMKYREFPLQVPQNMV